VLLGVSVSRALEGFQKAAAERRSSQTTGPDSRSACHTPLCPASYRFDLRSAKNSMRGKGFVYPAHPCSGCGQTLLFDRLDPDGLGPMYCM
jgi:hypothetical protein